MIARCCDAARQFRLLAACDSQAGSRAGGGGLWSMLLVRMRAWTLGQRSFLKWRWTKVVCTVQLHSLALVTTIISLRSVALACFILAADLRTSTCATNFLGIIFIFF